MEPQASTIRLPRDLHEWLRREAFMTRQTKIRIVITALEELRARRNHDPEDQRGREETCP